MVFHYFAVCSTAPTPKRREQSVTTYTRNRPRMPTTHMHVTTHPCADALASPLPTALTRTRFRTQRRPCAIKSHAAPRTSSHCKPCTLPLTNRDTFTRH